VRSIKDRIFGAIGLWLLRRTHALVLEGRIGNPSPKTKPLLILFVDHGEPGVPNMIMGMAQTYHATRSAVRGKVEAFRAAPETAPEHSKSVVH
jgi:hypothetical protein